MSIEMMIRITEEDKGPVNTKYTQGYNAKENIKPIASALKRMSESTIKRDIFTF